VHRSTVEIEFRTPPTILPLTVGGGGGSGMVIKRCAQIYGRHGSTQMDGLKEIPYPFDVSSFNGGGGGGVRNTAFHEKKPLFHIFAIFCLFHHVFFRGRFWENENGF
jgi:hypothetical protein